MNRSRTSLLALALSLGMTGCAPRSGEKDTRPPVSEGPEGRRKEAVQVLEIMRMAQVLEHSIDRALEIQLQANPKLLPFRDVMREFFARYMSWKSLEEDFIRMYTETFTAQELRDIADFYRTPTGVKALSSLPALMEKGAALGQQRVQEHMGELQEMVLRRVQELQGSAGAEGGEAPEGLR